MNYLELSSLTGMPELRAREMLRDGSLCLVPTKDQADLEAAIFDRIPSLAYGHEPGSVARTISFVEPFERSLTIHLGTRLGLPTIVGRVTPEFSGNSWVTGIPALRSGPSSQGVVLFREGIDAAVVIAEVTHRHWLEAIGELIPSTESSRLIYGGPTAEEVANIALDTRLVSPYGSILLRRLGALYDLPHTSIHAYGRVPGLVVEVVQHRHDPESVSRLTHALTSAGLDLQERWSPPGQLLFNLREPKPNDGPLLIRLVDDQSTRPRRATHLLREPESHEWKTDS